jgi:DNA (cytosine-5)-methyltransferase 1
MSVKQLSPKVSVCGASIDKLEIWNRIADVLEISTNSSRVGNRYFEGDGFASKSTIPAIEKSHCSEVEPDCGSCPLMHHCSYFRTSHLSNTEKPTTADLFSGAGGLGLGFEQYGFQSLLSIDKDEWAIFTHAYNHPRHSLQSVCADINEWLSEPTNHVDVDVLMGGPPCQSFSNANKQRQEDDLRDGLYNLFVDSIPLFNPKIILIENVRGFERVVPELRKLVDKKGYLTAVLKLNARDFGIPQNRVRIFTIGVKIQHFGKKESDMVLQRIVNRVETSKQKKRPLRVAIDDLRKLTASRMRNNTAYESTSTGFSIQSGFGLESEYVKQINHANISPIVFNHKARYNNDRDIEIFSRLKPGEDSTAKSIQDINPYKSRNGIFKDKYFKLKPDVPCKTITAHMGLDCNMYIHPNQGRGLTVREAARVQGFPDNYVFCGTLQAMYRQVGNAVPPPLAKIIAAAIHPEVVE